MKLGTMDLKTEGYQKINSLRVGQIYICLTLHETQIELNAYPGKKNCIS
jgi:hypothetical protein